MASNALAMRCKTPKRLKSGRFAQGKPVFHFGVFAIVARLSEPTAPSVRGAERHKVASKTNVPCRSAQGNSVFQAGDRIAVAKLA
jgi:hypothetical protein